MRRHIYILSPLMFTLVLWACGDSPSDPPPLQTGSIQITAQIDTVAVDSAEVFLDGIYESNRQLPCLLSGIEAGKHQLAVAKKDLSSPIDFNSIPQIVTVDYNKTTDAALQLTKFAPDFTLKNLADEEVSLENYRGKVVLLVFFSNT